MERLVRFIRCQNGRAEWRRRIECLGANPVGLPALSDTVRDVERNELHGLLQGALGKLSDVQREVVLLHDMEGWKHREIAQALHISEVSARQHLFVARKQLREILGPQVAKEYLS